jgi:hypothetical protein
MAKAKTRKTRARGRPPAAPELIRRNRVVTLLTDAEFKKLRKIADKEGRSASDLVHEAVLQFFRQHVKNK